MAHQSTSSQEVGVAYDNYSYTCIYIIYCVYKVDFKFLSSRPVVKAFHIRFEELRLDPNIQKWDVHVLQVSSMTYREHISAPQDGV